MLELTFVFTLLSGLYAKRSNFASELTIATIVVINILLGSMFLFKHLSGLF